MRFHAPAFTFCIATVAASSVLGQGWQRLPSRTPSPSDNPTTTAKVELGKKLFFDPRISLTGTVSCNSRHNLVEGGDDGRPTSMGIHGLVGPRNAPTVWNAAFQASQFWDGRSPSLEDQAKGPIVAAPEMGIPNHDHAIRRIAAIPGYQNEFREVFGGGTSGNINSRKILVERRSPETSPTGTTSRCRHFGTSR